MRWLGPAAWLTAWFACLGCSSEESDEFLGALDLSEVAGGAYAKDVTTQVGYANDKRVEYYDFGAVPVTSLDSPPAVDGGVVGGGAAGPPTVALAQPMYWFFNQDTDAPFYSLQRDMAGNLVLDGAGLASFDEGDPAHDCLTQSLPPAECRPPNLQHPIVDTIPGGSDGSYTGFWQVVKVKVPPNYLKDSIKSSATLLGRSFARTPLDVVIHCPILDPGGATVRSGITDRNRFGVAIRLWFRGKLGVCMLIEGGQDSALGLVPPPAPPPPPFPFVKGQLSGRDVLGVDASQAYIPTYMLMASTGPLAGPVPSSAVFAAPLGDPGYRPLSEQFVATVAADYVPGTYKKVADIPPESIMPDSNAPFKDLPLRAEIPACMGAMDPACMQLGLTCDMGTQFCRQACQILNDGTDECAPFGKTCDNGFCSD